MSGHAASSAAAMNVAFLTSDGSNVQAASVRASAGAPERVAAARMSLC